MLPASEQKRCHGFTLLELMISLAVFLSVAGATVAGMGLWQKHYRNTEVRNALQSRMRAALELMTQEIGQAGLVASGADEKLLAIPVTTISAAISGKVPSQTVTVSSTDGICDGEYIQIDAGQTNWEKVRVIKATGNQVTAVFANNHAAGTAVYARGVYPEGIIYPGTDTSATLTIFGDINSKGSQLRFVKYSCPTGTATALTRQEFDVTGNPVSTVAPLIDNVTDCLFTYTTHPAITIGQPLYDGYTLPADASGNPQALQPTFVTKLAISVTAKSETPDEFGNYVYVKKEYLNIQPRNILASFLEAGLPTINPSNPLETLELQFLPSTLQTGSTGNCTNKP
jgi:prepilin-type N-terminal cleavage/methylation domain-containing protein